MFPLPPTSDEVAADPSTALLVVLLASFAVLAGLVWRTYGHAKEASGAVNGVGPGEHRLYERVAVLHQMMVHLTERHEHMTIHLREITSFQREFSDKGWRSLPEGIDTGTGLASTIQALEQEAKQNREEHARIMELLDRLCRGD